MLHTNPFAGETIHPGPYRMGKGVEDANTYRVGHPLAQRVLAWGRALTSPPRRSRSSIPGAGSASLSWSHSSAERLAGCTRLTLRALETEDRLVFAGVTDDGRRWTRPHAAGSSTCPHGRRSPCRIPPATAAALEAAQAHRCQALLEEITTRNGHWFDTEMDKLDHWAEDRRASLKAELDELDDALKDAKKAARLAPTLPEKLERQRAARTLEASRDDAWRAYDQASREIDAQKDMLLDTISQRLAQHIEHEPLFTLRWQVV